jgi:hypothetical protein
MNINNTNDLDIGIDKTPEDPSLPKGSTPGRVLFYLCPIVLPAHSWQRYDVDVLDYDNDKAPFWMQEGAGIDYWIEEYIDIELEGYYVIESATVTWSKDYWGEVDEYWEIGIVRRATNAEVESESLEEG